MTTLEIEIKLMRYFNIRQNLIVPNVKDIIVGGKVMHECDLLMLSSSGYVTEFEIKISKNDLLKDQNKRHNHDHNWITSLYFAVPNELREIALEVIPERAGLYVLSKTTMAWGGEKISIEQAKKAIRRTPAIKWDFKDRFQLARLGTMRILGLKEKLNQQRLVNNGKTSN